MDIMRNCFTVGMAGLRIKINTISPRTCIYCMDYLRDGRPDFQINITKDDVKQEYLNSNGIKEDAISLETIAAYRKIVEKVLDYDMLLMHGAVIAVGNQAYMFSAPSGTGKTTHIKLWLQNIKNAYVVNGDKPLIKVTDNKVIACGTPWSGDEHLNTNVMVPLRSIILLERSEINHIEKISFANAYLSLLQQTYIPREAEMAKKALSLLLDIENKVSIWRFQCNNFAADSFSTSYTALIEQEG